MSRVYSRVTVTTAVTPPVTFDLCHVGHAAHTEAEVLSVESPGDGAGDAGLAHPWGAVEAEDLPLGGASELAHRYELLQGGRGIQDEGEVREQG